MLLIKCRSITNLARVCQVFPAGSGVKSQQCKSEPDRNWLLKKKKSGFRCIVSLYGKYPDLMFFFTNAKSSKEPSRVQHANIGTDRLKSSSHNKDNRIAHDRQFSTKAIAEKIRRQRSDQASDLKNGGGGWGVRNIKYGKMGHFSIHSITTSILPAIRQQHFHSNWHFRLE